MRPARCPACGHTGAVPRSLPTTATLRCVACGTRALARQCIGERPARFRHRNSAQAEKERRAREVIERLKAHDLDDQVDDLFIA